MKAVIIGASGSLGRSLAYEEARHKSDLVLVASDKRDLAALQSDLNLKFGVQVEIMALDLSNPELIASIDKDGDRYYFPIGSTIDGDSWGLDEQNIFRVFQINFLSVSAFISSLLSQPRVKSIEFVGFGSIAETRGRTGNVFYSAAKRSLTSLFESLLHSNQRQNIRPYLFQIGYMKSQLSFGKKMLFPPAEPNDVAATVVKYLGKKNPGIYYVPGFWRFVCMALRFVPWPIYRKLQF